MTPANSNNGTLEATKTVGTGALNNIAAREIRIGKMDPSAMLRASSGHYLEAGFDAFVVVHRALDAIEVSQKIREQDQTFINLKNVRPRVMTHWLVQSNHREVQ